MVELTVFTPTYNRADCLAKLYQSLVEQECRNFEWLIVDDGSTDDTREVIEAWQREGHVAIRYLYQENAGKMAAHNKGTVEAKGRFFVCIDSDDWMEKDAINTILYEVLTIESHNGVCGLVAYKGDEEGNLMKGQYFPAIAYASLFELAQKEFDADTTLVFATDIIVRYPFPKIGSEKFITEAYIYDQVGQSYKLKICRKILTICDYRSDGYSKNSNALHTKYPQGWMAFHLQRIGMEKKLRKKIAHAALYDAHALLAKMFFAILKNRFAPYTLSALPFAFRYYYNFTKDSQRQEEKL